MKTNQKNKQARKREIFFQRFMILMMIMVSTALVGCNTINDPDDDNGGNGKGRTLTAEEMKVKGAWGSVHGIPSGYVFAYSTPDYYVEKWQKGGSVFSFYVYDDNGTGHFAYSSNSGYGWSTYNWKVSGNKIHYSKNVGNNWTNGVQTAKNKKFDDDFVYFKVTVNDKGEPVLRTLKPETVEIFKPGETIDGVLSDPYGWVYYSEYDKLE